MSRGRRPNDEPHTSVALRFIRGGIEPSLAEVLSDPIVRLVTRRDGLSPDDLWRVVVTFRRSRRD